MQEGEVRGLHERGEMIIFEGHPLRVNLKKHPLRSHLVNAADGEGSGVILAANGWERVSEFMRHDAVGAVVYARGRCPERADLVVNAPPEGRAASAANDEKKKFVFGRVRFVFVDPLHGVDVIIV